MRLILHGKGGFFAWLASPAHTDVLVLDGAGNPCRSTSRRAPSPYWGKAASAQLRTERSAEGAASIEVFVAADFSTSRY